MADFLILLGLIALCAGIYGVFKGRIRTWVLPRGQFGWMAFAGLLSMVGGGIVKDFGNPVLGALAFIGWGGLWVGLYGLVRGRIGPLQGRRKVAMVIGGSLLAMVLASGIQGISNQATASKKAADEAAATQAKYQAALEHVTAKRWEQAIPALAELGTYKDAPGVLQEAKYQQALGLTAAGQWDSAVPLLTELGTYKDTAALLTEGRYHQAEAAAASKKWADAKQLLAQIPTGYKQVDTLLTTVNDGLTAQYYSEAMKAREREAYAEAEQLLNSAKSAGGTAPADLDAEVKAVTALRLEAEAEAAKKAAEEKAKAERISAEAGTKPENSSWDAAVTPVVSFLKHNLKDPDSVQYIEWSPVSLIEWKGKYAWGVRCKYRAKNSFGGYVIEEKIFFIRHDQVVDFTDL